MNFSAAKYWLLLACILATIYGTFVAWRLSDEAAVSVAPAAAPLTPAAGPAQPPLEDFVLTDQSGKPFDSRSLQGKPWVGSFFFTNCPAVCWRLNQTLAALQETNPKGEIHYVSITCDPDNDTPQALAKYAEHFHADLKRWTFLTGDMDLIRRIGNDFFQVGVEQGTHSDRAFAVDRAGRVRARFRLTEPEQVEMLKQVLAQLEQETVEELQAEEKPGDKTPSAENPPPSDPEPDQPADDEPAAEEPSHESPKPRDESAPAPTS